MESAITTTDLLKQAAWAVQNKPTANPSSAALLAAFALHRAKTLGVAGFAAEASDFFTRAEKGMIAVVAIEVSK
jgi:hypothetical protein